jgi:D-glycero-D-manno-heptose 1,7-bisphosphate phosphatase
MRQQVTKARAVFLDRDGVLNRARVVQGKSYPPASLEGFELLPDVDQAVNELKKAGFLIIVVTNQPDVATGIQSKAVVESMHKKLSDCLPVDAIYVCYHTDEDDCQCRKPKPGMLEQAAHEFNIDLTQSILVGDRWKDIEAGQRVGCRCFFIDYAYQERKPEASYQEVDSLASAAALIL